MTGKTWFAQLPQTIRTGAILLLLAGSAEAQNVRVVVNTLGTPNLAQAELCLLAADGTVRREETGNDGQFVFQNVAAGPTIVRAWKSGFNPQDQSRDLEPIAEERFTFTLNPGNGTAVPCNVVGPSDIVVSLANSAATAVAGGSIRYRLRMENIGQARATAVVASVNFSQGVWIALGQR
jgi:hypothetical protein